MLPVFSSARMAKDCPTKLVDVLKPILRIKVIDRIFCELDVVITQKQVLLEFQDQKACIAHIQVTLDAIYQTS